MFVSTDTGVSVHRASRRLRAPGQQASPCTGPTRDARSAGAGPTRPPRAQRRRACCTAACCTSRGRQPLGYSDRPGRWSQPGSHRPNPRAQDRSAAGPRAAGTAYLMLNKGKKTEKNKKQPRTTDGQGARAAQLCPVVMSCNFYSTFLYLWY